MVKGMIVARHDGVMYFARVASLTASCVSNIKSSAFPRNDCFLNLCEYGHSQGIIELSCA